MLVELLSGILGLIGTICEIILVAFALLVIGAVAGVLFFVYVMWDQPDMRRQILQLTFNGKKEREKAREKYNWEIK